MMTVRRTHVQPLQLNRVPLLCHRDSGPASALLGRNQALIDLSAFMFATGIAAVSAAAQLRSKGPDAPDALPHSSPVTAAGQSVATASGIQPSPTHA